MPNRITNQSDGSDSVRYLNASRETLVKTIEQFSSGWKVDRASDDPAALAISEQLRGRIASLNQEIEDTTAMIRKQETAESLLEEFRLQVRNLRAMIKEAMEATTGDGAREILQNAIAAAAQRYDYLARTASYDGTAFFDGSEGSAASLSSLAGIDVSTVDTARNSMAILEKAEAETYAAQVNVRAVEKGVLESRRAALEVTEANLTASESAIRGADTAEEIAVAVREELLLRSDLAMQSHADVNRPAVVSVLFGE